MKDGIRVVFASLVPRPENGVNMSTNNSITTKALGLALLVIAAGLAYWGYQISETLTSQLTAKLSGSMPDPVMFRYIGAAASGVAGLFLVAKG